MNRVGFMGGSDANTLINRPEDWHKLWLVKTGREQPEDLSHVFPVQLGNFTENFHMDWIDRKALVPSIGKRQAQFHEIINGVPYQGTVDAITGGEEAIIEVKHVSGRLGNLQAYAEYYMPQMQLYMRLSKIPRCFFSVIMGNQEPQVMMIRANTAAQEEVLYLCQKFWWFVENDKPIEDTDTVTFDKIDWSQVNMDDLVAYDFSSKNSWMAETYNYIQHEESAKEFDRAKKALREMIPDDARQVTGGGVTATRARNGSVRFKVESSS